MIINLKTDITLSGIHAHKVDWNELEDIIREELGADEVEIIDADCFLEQDDENPEDEIDEEDIY